MGQRDLTTAGILQMSPGKESQKLPFHVIDVIESVHVVVSSSKKG